MRVEAEVGEVILPGSKRVRAATTFVAETSHRRINTRKLPEPSEIVNECEKWVWMQSGVKEWIDIVHGASRPALKVGNHNRVKWQSDEFAQLDAKPCGYKPKFASNSSNNNLF